MVLSCEKVIAFDLHNSQFDSAEVAEGTPAHGPVVAGI